MNEDCLRQILQHVEPNIYTYLRLLPTCKLFHEYFTSDSAWKYLDTYGYKTGIFASFQKYATKDDFEYLKALGGAASDFEANYYLSSKRLPRGHSKFCELQKYISDAGLFCTFKRTKNLFTYILNPSCQKIINRIEDKQIAWCLLNVNPKASRYISQNLMLDRSFALWACKKYPGAIIHVALAVGRGRLDKEFLLAALPVLSQDVIRIFPKALWFDIDVIKDLIAVDPTKYPMLFPFDGELNGEEKILFQESAKAALSTHGLLLEYFQPTGDYGHIGIYFSRDAMIQLILAALNNDGRALKFVAGWAMIREDVLFTAIRSQPHNAALQYFHSYNQPIWPCNSKTASWSQAVHHKDFKLPISRYQQMNKKTALCHTVPVFPFCYPCNAMLNGRLKIALLNDAAALRFVTDDISQDWDISVLFVSARECVSTYAPAVMHKFSKGIAPSYSKIVENPGRTISEKIVKKLGKNPRYIANCLSDCLNTVRYEPKKHSSTPDTAVVVLQAYKTAFDVFGEKLKNGKSLILLAIKDRGLSQPQ